MSRLRDFSRFRGAKHSTRGERNRQARLTDAEVAELRRRRAAGEGRRALATEYGISPNYVSDLVSGRWRAGE